MPRERNTNHREIAGRVADKDGNWQLFVIAAEGDRTEPNYFTEFEAEYKKEFDERNLHVEFIDKESSAHSDPNHVYETLKRFCEELEKVRDLQAYDELWLVIDTDDYENRKDAILRLVEKCKEKPLYYLALSWGV
ncbi:RloB family protein [Desulfonema magnum]|uniref:RloB domain-containing protein n=1 Tax=Desulfonema magnum TaxID=45655 RepID=A0A975GQ51_9BACT|nr:RloB family protein [Desulfonema magnum]QTA89681.1 RloB domain-containing protein [Desulfonema magnum]